MKEIIDKITKAIFEEESLNDEEIDSLFKELNFQFPEKAWDTLKEISKQIKFNSLFPDFFPLLIHELSLSFDPDMALNNFERFSELIYDKNYLYTIFDNDCWKLNALIVLFSGSQLLSDTLFQEPAYFDWLLNKDAIESPKFKDVLYEELELLLEDAVSYEDKFKVLRQFRKREFLRIGLRDLLRKADLVEIVEDLSNLADVCLQKAYEFCYQDLTKKFGTPMFIDKDEQERPCAFVVLGMGKLGGRELNFSSDIDLMYLYSSDNGSTTGVKDIGDKVSRKISNHEFYCRLAQMITSAINDVTEDGFVFRVDLRLRPEGISGDIAGSLRSYEIYYESWGEAWERQALIKARPVAGSERLGREFLDTVRPFVYRKYLDYSYLEEIKDMKERIDQNAKKKKKKGEDVKLGSGGIREVEFLVQAIQLIYGGREKWLKERNTLRALHKISEKGVLTYREYSELTKAYIFLRELENRIQIYRGLQVHELPKDKNEIVALAKKMGIRGGDRKSIAKELMSSLKKNQQNVRDAYENLFYSDSFRPGKEDDQKIDLFSGEAGDPIVLEYLKKNRFRFPEKAHRNLILLHEGGPLYHPAPESKKLFRSLAPVIVDMCSQVPDPDLAVNNLERFITTTGSRRMHYTLFKEQKRLLKNLLVLFGSSEFLSNILIRKPDLIYLFDPSGSIIEAKSKEELKERLTDLINKSKNKEDVLDEFRKFKQREELRIGISAIMNKKDCLDTTESLTDLADISLIKALDMSLLEVTKRYGKPTEEISEGKIQDSGFAIIGVGKLGGRELDFGSDLDVMFVYSKDGSTTGIDSESGSIENTINNSVFFTKVYEEISKVISGITQSGFMYKIDARLRPDGTKGVMVISLDALRKYLLERAALWEKQALIKSRFIAGDEALGNETIKTIQDSIYQKEFDPAIAQEMDNMRMRIEAERGKESGECRDAKLGYGGLLDIEFIVQFLQLKYGEKHKSLKDVNTLTALEGLREKELLSLDDYEKLKKAYIFLREIVFNLRIEHERPSSSLPEPGYKRDILARRLGYTETDKEDLGESLFHEYSACTDEIRSIYRNIFDSVMTESC